METLLRKAVYSCKPFSPASSFELHYEPEDGDIESALCRFAS